MTENIHTEEERELEAAAGDAAVADAVVETVQPVQPGPGSMFAAAREARGMSLAEVAAQLRLSIRQIEALEADDYEKLPSATFLRGFIRNYAKVLQLDAAPLLEAYQAAQPQPETQAIAAPSRQIEFGAPANLLKRYFGRDANPWIKYAAGGLVVLILLPLGLYQALHEDRPPVETKPAMEANVTPLALPQPPAAEVTAAAPVPAAPEKAPEPVAVQAPVASPQTPVAPPAPPVPAVAPAPVAAPPVAPAPVAAAAPKGTVAQGRIKMVFKGDSWVKIKDGNGKTVFSQLNHAGSEQVISGAGPFSLIVGNARVVVLTFNDKPVDLAPYTKVDVAYLNLE